MIKYILLITVLVSSCKTRNKATETIILQPIRICEPPQYISEFRFQFYLSNGNNLTDEIHPLVANKDSSALSSCLNNYLKYPEFCKEMAIQGYVYFMISKDSTGEFTQLKTLRSMDNTCTELMEKDIRKFLLSSKIIGLKPEINEFVTQMKIILY